MIIDSFPLQIVKKIQKAHFAIDLNHYDLAIEIAKEILQYDPEESEAYLILARAHLMKEDVIAASTAIKEALRLKPDDSYAHALYAQVLEELGKKKEAQREFEIALSLNPFSSSIHRSYALFLSEKKKEKERALFHARKALELEPEDAFNHVVMARVLTANKQYKEAEQCFAEALRIAPDDFATQYFFGWYWIQRNRFDLAYSYLKEAVRIDPSIKEVREQFLLAFKAQNKLYSVVLFFLMPVVKRGCLGIVGLILAVVVLNTMFNETGLPIVANVLAGIAVFYYILFMIFGFFDYVLDFLIQRGWYKP